MRTITYLESKDRLVYLDENATPEFWDTRWENEGKPHEIGPHDDVVRITKKYLSAGAKIIEGGCGRANKIRAMVDAGYDAIGVDFAMKTVNQAILDYPGLDIRKGDVRSLEFPDNYFDGYWSIGVIEHFWNGYDEILAEAARVVKPNGIMFISAPWFSPYRKKLARNKHYPLVEYDQEPEKFYQYALSREEITGKLMRHGFTVKKWYGRASEISIREDMKFLEPQIEWLFASRGSIIKRIFRKTITNMLNPYCGHSFLAVTIRNNM